MINKRNAVYTRVKNAIAGVCTNCSTVKQTSPPAFPYMYLKQVDNSGFQYDLSGNEKAVTSSIEISVYTTGTGALSQNDNIFLLVDNTMISLGYRRIYGVTPIDNLSDSNITQQIARYARVIADNDTL